MHKPSAAAQLTVHGKAASYGRSKISIWRGEAGRGGAGEASFPRGGEEGVPGSGEPRSAVAHWQAPSVQLRPQQHASLSTSQAAPGALQTASFQHMFQTQ